MPRATVTVREIKNKETCLDLAVVSYKEVPASFMRSTYEFQIVVVSSLSCFKLPSHKDSDVVQFAVYKKFNEFEELRDRLNEAYAGTVFPPLEKKSIMVNETVLKERRRSLDIFVKFVAAAPRISTCHDVLAFLEVDPQKARHFSAGPDETPSKENKIESQEETNRLEGKGSSSLFEEVDEESEDFLALGSKGSGNDEIASWSGSIDFFSPSEDSYSTGAHLFEVQDLKRELTEEDEKNFSFIPDAIIKKKETVTSVEDDRDDLLNLGDDYELEQLVLQKSVQKQEQQKGEKPDQQLKQGQATSKPPPQKPTIAAKPKLKPPVPSRPTSGGPDSAGKPAVPHKPVPAPRKLREEALKPAPTVSVPESKAEAKGDDGDDAVVPAKGTELTTDDIMSYIAANTVEDESVDLFS